MLDFRLDTYRALLEAFLQAGYRVLTYEQYCDLQACPGTQASPPAKKEFPFKGDLEGP